jgi:hypothetical protein
MAGWCKRAPLGGRDGRFGRASMVSKIDKAFLSIGMGDEPFSVDAQDMTKAPSVTGGYRKGLLGWLH